MCCVNPEQLVCSPLKNGCKRAFAVDYIAQFFRTTVGDFNQFKNGAQFGAWLGLTPRQNSSGGKSNLGGITKRGEMYLRMLLIQGAKSAVMTAHKRSDLISKWLFQLREKSGWQKAAVAMANKNARILWAMMTKGCRFDHRHVNVKPAGAMPLPVAAQRARQHLYLQDVKLKMQ